MGWNAFARRWLGRASRTGVLLVAVVLLAVLGFLTVDLGPVAREYAERYGSRAIERPLHLGRVKIRLGTGDFVVENVTVEGLTPTDRPFFTARQVVVSFPWWTLLFHRAVLIDSVELTDWRMVVELLPDGRTNLPKLKSDRPPNPSRLTTTVQFVHATRGEFTYIDHKTWTTVSRNLDVQVLHVGEYRGRASFSDGTVSIRDYVPMRSAMRCSFKIEGSRVHLNWIDLTTDGARSRVTGDVDFGHWPEQLYRVRSRVEFPRMREIFFAREKFSLSGTGEFLGTFHLFKGGHELKGTFTSPLAGVNGLRFPGLRGALVWRPARLDVFDTTAGFHGGRVRFTYAIAPIGAPTPAVARFDARYEGVDLAGVSDFLALDGLRLGGTASGRTLLEWPLGRFAEHRGEGHLSVAPPAGVALYSRRAPAVVQLRTDEEEAARMNPGPLPPLAHQAVGADLVYRFGPEWIDLDPGWVATETTYVEFRGRTAYGDECQIPFYARSADWQESDRLLAAVITAFGSRTATAPLGGHGEFQGVLLRSFRRPRIEGTFTGDQTRAWNVVWGHATGRVVVEGGYVDVAEASVTRDGATIEAAGRFSLSYPRPDAGEEINARFRIDGRPLRDLRHAFDLDAYPVDGRISGEYHVYGRYNRPFGFGRAVISEAEAYGEPIERATASLRFEGVGVRFDGVEMTKGGGTITGAAYVGWDGRYSFNADGRRIPMESLAFVRYPRAPLSGLMVFTAGGTGFFADPRYDGRVRIDDLFISDEGVGQVTGRFGVRDNVLTFEGEAASPRLAVGGTGRIALDPDGDTELSIRFTDTSLDPYVRAFEPRLSPFTSAIASGTLRVVGQLTRPERLLADATVEHLDLRLFDYQLRNAGPIALAFDHNVIRLGTTGDGGRPVQLVGFDASGARDTRLDLAGTIDLDGDRIDARADGEANLGILQGFFRNIRSSGQARLSGRIQGPLEKPVFSGSAEIANGRIRYFSLPHAIDAINGRVSFSSGGIRIEDVTAQVGSGNVHFGGLIGLNGYVPEQLSLTATGENMRLRYPEGFRSVVDADLALVGTLRAPVLKGTVTVDSAVYDKRVDLGTSLLELVGGAGGGEAPPPGPAPAAEPEPTLPLRYDIRIVAPSTLQVRNNLAQIVSSADLSFRGTYDRPLLFGRAEVERGKAIFEGKQYVVTHGTIDFSNPSRIEPYFDVEAETRVRAQGQTYIIDLRFTGTMNRLDPQLTSDPPLPPVDIFSLLFSGTPQVQDPELRTVRQPGYAEKEILTSRFARSLSSDVVDRFVEEAIGLDTFQITPWLIDPYQRLSPGARLTIGKRISDRVYLTFSRSLTAPNDQIIWLVEYDVTDRLSWVLSKNEDRTYALDVRVRHAF